MSLFRSPSAITFVGPSEPIDCGQRYLVKVSNITDEGISKFAKDPTGPNPEHSIKWVFRLATMPANGQLAMPVLDSEGNPYELWDFSSDRTGRGSGKTAKARLWIEALLGREIEDNEINNIGLDELVGKVAVALFEEKNTNPDDNEGQIVNTRIKILKLSPYKGAAPKEAPAPAPAPKPADAVPF